MLWGGTFNGTQRLYKDINPVSTSLGTEKCIQAHYTVFLYMLEHAFIKQACGE